jgi:hypothetical protein
MLTFWVSDAPPLPATLVSRGASCVFHCQRSRRQAPAYVCFEDEPGRRSAAKLPTRDEARRIAVNIAKLPEQFDLDQITSFCDPLRFMHGRVRF